MQFPRASGILLHPTSLPGKFGIGELGAEAFKFVDFLADAKQTYWQMLPLTPTGYGDSPYSSFSAFAGNTLLISSEPGAAATGFIRPIKDEELISQLKPPATAGGSDRVDYGAVYQWKNKMLQIAFNNFHSSTNAELSANFETFVLENESWLEDYALYRAIKKSQGQKSWNEWDEPLKLRDKKALDDAAEKLFDDIQAEKFYQFLFFRQWFELKEYANKKGIKMVGDVPIFVAHDSSDVWRNQDLFKLNADGTARVVAGVPPDYFSATGQLWGNPIYDWDAMRRDGFLWWRERVKHALKIFDVVRIDHFRGFAAAWEVPGSDATAENGRWVEVPGNELFTALKNAFGELPFWVEDLGDITPDVEKLRDEFSFPGMRILQFAFGGDAHSNYLPHNYIRNCVAYTGTHDNDTTVGWHNMRKKSRPNAELEFALKYLGSDGSEIQWDFIRALFSSVADTVIIPMQDILGLDNNARMNLPASQSGNWNWRFSSDKLTDELKLKLREMTEIYGRKK